MRESLAACSGDLAVTAQKLRACQRTLFKPPALTLARVVVALRDVAERSDMAVRVRGARSLLVAAGSEETLLLVKAMQGAVRYLGFSKNVIISALAMASESCPPSLHRPAMIDPVNRNPGSRVEEINGLPDKDC